MVLLLGAPVRAVESGGETIHLKPGLAAKGKQTVPVQGARKQDSGWRPILWRVSGKGIAANYLFGTIHLPSPLTTVLPAEAQEAFSKAGAVFCEIPFDAESLQKVTTLAATAKTPLSSAIPVELYERTKAALRRIDRRIDLKQLESFELWNLAIQLTILEDQIRYPEVIPLDLRLYSEGSAAGKRVGGLETVEEEVSVMQMPVEDQMHLLEAALDELDEAAQAGESLSAPLLKAYFSGELESLQTLLHTTLSRYSPTLRTHFESSLLDGRNRTMAERIVNLVTKSPETCHFFAVGAMHFVGENSIPVLIEKAGLSVERIPNPAGASKKMDRQPE